MSKSLKNPFKVGDKVRLTEEAWTKWSSLWSNSGFRMGRVVEVLSVVDEKLYTSVDKDPAHYSHFELVTEDTNMTKTKRIPFSIEAWEKYKDVAKVYIHNTPCVKFLPMANDSKTQGYALYTIAQGTEVNFNSCWQFDLEIPVKTKRIPFNPTLKDAKVFYGRFQLVEWFALKSGLVCGTHERVVPFTGLDSTLYRPNDLEMEVEEEDE